MVYLTCASIPGTPSTPILEYSSKTTATIAWDEPTSSTQAEVTGYRVYVNNLSVGDWVMNYEGMGYPTRNVYNITGLEEGQMYRIKMTALNSVGESSNSSEITVIASDFPSAPSQP